MSIKHVGEYENKPSNSLLYHTEAKKFNRWIFDKVKSYIKGTTLEIKSGGGHLAELCLNNNIQLWLSDSEDHFCQALSEKHKEETIIRGILQIDITNPDFNNCYSDILGRFSTVVILNIFQHLPVDKQSITHAKLLLRKRGHLLILMPATTDLFHELDQGIDEWESYNMKSLKNVLGSDLDFLMIQYFNLVGIVGWWLFGLTNKQKVQQKKQLTDYEKQVPLFYVEEGMNFSQLGLSIIAVARKH